MSLKFRLAYGLSLLSLTILSDASLASGESFRAATAPITLASAQIHGNELAGPDLHALKYFAQQGDIEKYNKELLRLKLSYPGFQVPTDPLNADQNPDQPLWDLYATGRIDELEALITRQKASRPYWAPDPQLIAKIEQHKVRKLVLEARATHDYATVKQLANQSADIVRPDDPDILWAVAEALAEEKNLVAATELFEAMLGRFEDPDLLQATLQKAARHLPLADAAQLYKSLLRDAPQTFKTQPLQVAFGRGLVIRANAYGLPLPRNFDTELSHFADQAKQSKDWADLTLLAWTSYNSEDYGRALDLFAHLPTDPDHAKAIEGRILSLKQVGKVAEAQALSARWKSTNDDLSRLYVSLHAPYLLDRKGKALDQTFLLDYADHTKKRESGAGAEALGWYAFDLKQYSIADAWFSKATEWQPTETAAYGKVLVASMTGNKQAFDALKGQYGPLYNKVAKLSFKARTASRSTAGKRITGSDRLSRAHRKGDYQGCLALADRLIERGRGTAQVHQTRGWCLMQLDRPTEAQFAFEKSLQVSGGGKVASRTSRLSTYGAGLAALQRGKTRDAEQLANTGRLSRQHQIEIDRGVLAQKAVEAFRQKRYLDCLHLLGQRAQIASEPRNLSELRAWSLYHVGDFLQAHRLFVSLNSVVSSKSVRDGIKVTRRKVSPSLLVN